MKKILTIAFCLMTLSAFSQEPVKIDCNGSALYVYPEDLFANRDDGVTWYNHYGAMKSIGANSKTDGKSNTSILLQKHGDLAEAAKMCADLNAYGHNDWYLPSVEELQAIYNSRDKVKNMGASYYWSSTEKDDYTAYMIQFDTGERSGYNKASRMKIRPVRRD